MKRRTFLRSSLGAVAAASLPFPERLDGSSGEQRALNLNRYGA